MDVNTTREFLFSELELYIRDLSYKKKEIESIEERIQSGRYPYHHKDALKVQRTTLLSGYSSIASWFTYYNIPMKRINGEYRLIDKSIKQRIVPEDDEHLFVRMFELHDLLRKEPQPLLKTRDTTEKLLFELNNVLLFLEEEHYKVFKNNYPYSIAVPHRKQFVTELENEIASFATLFVNQRRNS